MLSNHPSVLGSGGGTAYSLIGGTGLFADGTAAAPSISFAADTDTGFYRRSDNAIGFAIGGVAQGYMVTSGSAWRIANGISSATRLDLFDNGAITLTASGTNQNITLTPSGSGGVESTAFRSTVVGGYSQFACYNGASQAGALGYEVGVNRTYLTTNAASSVLDLCISGTAGNGIRILNSGRALLGTTTDSGARLQLGGNTDTTSAGGIVFGTDCNIYRLGTNTAGLGAGGNTTLFWDANNFGGGAQTAGVAVISRSGISAALPGYSFYADNNTGMFSDLGDTIKFSTGGVTALTLDASQGATFAAGITTGGSIVCAAGGTVQWNGRSALGAPSDGVIRLTNNAGSDFTRLQFGGTTASFPALQRSGTLLQAVVGDGSAYCGFVALTGSFTSVVVRSIAATAGAGEVSYGGTTATTVGAAGGASALPATPTGYIIVNVAGTQMKVPYYAN